MAKIYRHIDNVLLDYDPNVMITRRVISKGEVETYYINDMYRLYLIIRGQVKYNDENISKYDMITQNNTDLKLKFIKRTELLIIDIICDMDKEGIEIYHFDDMVPMAHKFPISLIPKSLYRLFSPADIFLLTGPQKVFINNDYYNRGPNNFIMVLSNVRGNSLGAPLHTHINSTEIFFVAKGSFKVTANKRIYYLDKGDLAVIPKDMYRKFENCSDDDSIIIPIVLGTNDESEDIIIADEAKNEIIQQKGIIGKFLIWIAQKAGVRFE